MNAILHGNTFHWVSTFTSAPMGRNATVLVLSWICGYIYHLDLFHYDFLLKIIHTLPMHTYAMHWDHSVRLSVHILMFIIPIPLANQLIIFNMICIICSTISSNIIFITWLGRHHIFTHFWACTKRTLGREGVWVTH